MPCLPTPVGVSDDERLPEMPADAHHKTTDSHPYMSINEIRDLGTISVYKKLHSPKLAPDIGHPLSLGKTVDAIKLIFTFVFMLHSSKPPPASGMFMLSPSEISSLPRCSFLFVP